MASDRDRGWDRSDRPPAAGLGMAALLVAVGLLLLLVGWLAITTFLAIVTDLGHLS